MSYDGEDESLVRAFESGELLSGQFTHTEHVRVAWWYLRHHALPDALARFSTSLKRLAAAKGVPGLYHETITVAFVLLIAERLDEARGAPWTVFAERNADLLAWKPSILSRYYTDETLWSDRARRTFVMPDRIGVPVLQ